MWYALTFFAGACAGGAGIGWVFWNKKAKIQAELEALRSRVGA